MKNFNKSFLLIIGISVSLFQSSCSDDDNTSGGGGDDSAIMITQQEMTTTTQGSYTLAAYSYAENDLDPGDSGENVVWDFSGQENPQSTILSTTGACPGNQNCGQFTDANRIQWLEVLDTSPTYTYFSFTNNEYSVIGDYSVENGKNTYNDQEILYKFPIVYGQAFDDNYQTSFGTSPDGTTNGEVSIEVDGYGTIITPAGTFNNVLRIKRLRTVTNPNIPGFVVNSEEYEWLDNNGIGRCIVQNAATTFNGNTVKASVLLYTITYTSSGN